MRQWSAYQINRRLISKNAAGHSVQPGGNVAKRWVQPEGSDVAIIARGDAFDLYIGKKQIYNVTMSVQIAKELGFWLVKWWIFNAWCGVKLRLWYWSLGVLLEEPREQRKAPSVVGR